MKIFYCILLFSILSCGGDEEQLIVEIPLNLADRIELIFGTYTGTEKTNSFRGESIFTEIPYTVEDYPYSPDSIYIIGDNRRKVFIDTNFSWRQELGNNDHYTYSFNNDTLKVSGSSSGNLFSYSYIGIKN